MMITTQMRSLMLLFPFVLNDIFDLKDKKKIKKTIETMEDTILKPVALSTFR